MAQNPFVLALHILSPILGIAACLRLWQTGLSHTFRTLIAFLLAHALRSILLFSAVLFPHPKSAYFWIWAVTSPMLWIVSILLALKIHSTALANYKGLQTMGRWAFMVAVPLSVLISGASLMPSLLSPTERFPLVSYVVLAERGVTFSLVIFILVILFFLTWYPIRLSRNTIRHCILCSIYFLCWSVGYLIRNLQGHEVVRAVNVGLLAVTALCYVGWLTLLNARGEASQVTTGREFQPEDEQRLIEQLTAINGSLLRATRNRP
jgi:hypothetical protein